MQRGWWSRGKGRDLTLTINLNENAIQRTPSSICLRCLDNPYHSSIQLLPSSAPPLDLFQSLTLRSINLNENAIQHLSDALTSNSALVALDLSNNSKNNVKIGDEGEFLPKGRRTLDKMVVMLVRWAAGRGEGACRCLLVVLDLSLDLSNYPTQRTASTFGIRVNPSPQPRCPLCRRC